MEMKSDFVRKYIIFLKKQKCTDVININGVRMSMQSKIIVETKILRPIKSDQKKEKNEDNP